MRVTVVTIRVPANPLYDSCTARWLNSYINFKPEMEHDLVVVDSDKAAEPGPFRDHGSRFLLYTGGGWDCGIWQMVGQRISTDLLVCCNSSTHFVRPRWLERIVDAVREHGVGLYGPMASLAHHPHIRTPCMVFQPEVIRGYPHLCDSRPKTFGFECLSGKENFTLWCAAHGYPPRMVTWDGCYELSDWRKPADVFWKGNQSNLIVKDRHADRYDVGTPEERTKLTKEADGK